MASNSAAINKTKFLSDEEYVYLLELLKRNREAHPRDTTLIEVSMNTGARPSEILAVTASDLDKSSNTVFIRGIKGSRDREIPLPPELFARVLSLAKNLKPEERVFPIALRTYQTIWHNYRPAKKGVKSLRHSFALRLYERTKDVRLVQMALGHRYLNTTQIYVDYVYNQEELRKLLL